MQKYIYITLLYSIHIPITFCYIEKNEINEKIDSNKYK